MPKQIPLQERFWSKVRKMESGCWEWQAYLTPGGYGSFWYKGRMRPAHRAAWEITNGEITGGLHVLHKCDNRKCVNPDHLYLGTNQDNMDDRRVRGRTYRMPGELHHKAVLTEADVRAIRKSDELLRVLAERYGVSIGQIWRIRTNQSWRHVA